MPRVSSQRTRQFLLVTGEPLDPDIVPEKVQLYSESGEPLSIPISSRRTVSKTTAVLDGAVDLGTIYNRKPGGGESGAWNMGIGVMLTKIEVSKPCRVRLYTSASKRDADVNRDRFTDPKDYGGTDLVPDHGCLSEFLLITIFSLENIPADYVVSGDGGSNIYYRIDNFDLTAGAVTVTLTIKDVEQ